MNINILNIATSTTIFYKEADGVFKSVPEAGITLKVHLHDSMCTVGYVVNGNEYDCLYKQSEDGKSMVPLDSYNASVGTEVLCAATGRSLFYWVDSDWNFTVYKADGAITETTIHLEDGDYDAEFKQCSVLLKLGWTMEDNGYKGRTDAEFFNSYTADGEKHPAVASRVVPTKNKLRIGMNAIKKMVETLEANGLMFVYDSDCGRLGVINKLSPDEYYMDDVDSCVPVIAIPFYPQINMQQVGDCWRIKLK